jgi:hypothetical protein
MALTSKRFLGDIDAASDEHFKEHFVESSDLESILTNHSDIIYGSKGVGKTALRRALAELHGPRFFTTKTIDLENLSFLQVHDALCKLNETTKTEVAGLARNTWRNVLATYCIEAVAECLPAHDLLKHKINAYLTEEGFKNVSSGNRMTHQIEKLFILIGEAGLEEHASKVPKLGLSSRQRSVVSSFPASPAVTELLAESAKRVADSGKSVLLCLDGFDSIVDHSPESRRAIFAGLIDAVFKNSKDPLLAKGFCIKAFLPQELTDAARAIVWDADKFHFNTHCVRWSELEFHKFLMKRLTPYSRKKSSVFADVWHEYMPEKIRNDTHNTTESSFGYILRHTLYRPRQILTHLQKILDSWDKKNAGFRVDPTFIPPIVAMTNYDLAEGVVNQLEIGRAGLSNFMKSWSGAANTMPAGDFQDRMKRIFGFANLQESNTLFNELFNFGIFGIARKNSATKGAQQTNFIFGYVGDRFTRNIHATVDPNDILALGPMFHEYCGCVKSEYGVVIPVAVH